MKKILFSFLVALFFLAPQGASAQGDCVDTCEACNITEENIELWQILDFNGDGVLTTADRAILGLFQNITGIDCLNETIVNTITQYDIDLNGDGVFDGRDWTVVNAFTDYFDNLAPDDSITVQELDDCLTAVILGDCP